MLKPFLIAATLALAPAATLAEADGPDAWRVVNVPANDTLNIRMGPGTGYAVLGKLAPNARHLARGACVPFVPRDVRLDAADREALPPRWCFVDGGAGRQGWVSARYLGEDVAAGGAGGDTAGVGAPYDIALPLVRNLFHKAAFLDINDPAAMRAYFSSYTVPGLANRGAHPILDAQDADLANVAVRFADPPVIQGMATVIVTYENFGQPRRAEVHLRPDPDQGGAIRIFRIVHDSGAVVE
ncbi:hypothetical protein OG2516_15924 [Oceanicola granulosus HTCC2516]|uniref:SH3b domain-containing protein n=1 Tax=Oceanicola granulosus (strain ATCC BAA-861 / DSM 15982 / KCTC 12143 / HTCC2516) TaxID=314256 RepID=Q2CAM8_OCEGH|nr:SH3 domain-containing protein [Oceanicola granulosus]EAR49724.1 hypothetical protein OG2516_15924 [Oceanicola granulosus HTCC2516]